MTNKKCPYRVATRFEGIEHSFAAHSSYEDFLECIKQDCAIWNEEDEHCGLIHKRFNCMAWDEQEGCGRVKA